MMRFLKLGLIIIAAAAVAPALRAEHADPVAVLASADPAYVRSKFPGTGAKPRAESYLFAQGRFFGGGIRDGSLEHMQFLDIARILEPALAKHDYFPTGDRKAADLLLVVHWGSTDVGEQDQWLAQRAAGDVFGAKAPSEARNAPGHGAIGAADSNEGISLSLDEMQSEQNLTARSAVSNQQLLGFSGAIAKEESRSAAIASGFSQEDHDLRDDLLEERYFVILMAFDYHAIVKGAKPKLLWSIHFNVRSPGHNFATALPMMSNVAADYFGRNMDGLVIDAGKVPVGRVDIGEAKTIDDAKPK
jgi:hypothetical protein